MLRAGYPAKVRTPPPTHQPATASQAVLSIAAVAGVVVLVLCLLVLAVYLVVFGDVMPQMQ